MMSADLFIFFRFNCSVIFMFIPMTDLISYQLCMRLYIYCYALLERDFFIFFCAWKITGSMG